MTYHPIFRDVGLAALIALPMIIPTAPSPRARPAAATNPASSHPQIVQLAQADTPRFTALD